MKTSTKITFHRLLAATLHSFAIFGFAAGVASLIFMGAGFAQPYGLISSIAGLAALGMLVPQYDRAIRGKQQTPALHATIWIITIIVLLIESVLVLALLQDQTGSGCQLYGLGKGCLSSAWLWISYYLFMPYILVPLVVVLGVIVLGQREGANTRAKE